jgi:hypothetical protein
MRYLIILLLFISCDKYKDPVDILQSQGYTEIEQLPSRMLDCTRSGKMHHSYSFKARKDGKPVKGAICYNWEGGYSIEIKSPRKYRGGIK